MHKRNERNNCVSAIYLPVLRHFYNMATASFYTHPIPFHLYSQTLLFCKHLASESAATIHLVGQQPSNFPAKKMHRLGTLCFHSNVKRKRLFAPRFLWGREISASECVFVYKGTVFPMYITCNFPPQPPPQLPPTQKRQWTSGNFLHRNFLYTYFWLCFQPRQLSCKPIFVWFPSHFCQKVAHACHGFRKHWQRKISWAKH